MSAATVGMHYVAATLTETVAANSAQPPAIVSPGKSLDDAEGAWPRTVVKYKGKLIQNGTLLTGFLSAVGRDHVQVGSRRAVVPYDYLVLATGKYFSLFTGSVQCAVKKCSRHGNV